MSSKWIVAYVDSQHKKHTRLFNTQQQAFSKLSKLDIGIYVEIAEVEKNCDGDWTIFDPTYGYIQYTWET